MPEIDVAAQNLLVDVAGAVVLEVDVDVREIGEVRLERLAELVEAHTVHGPNADAPGHQVAQPLQLGLHRVEELEDLSTGPMENLSRGRRPYAAALALEQPLAVALFESANLLADGGLRDEVLRRGE